MKIVVFALVSFLHDLFTAVWIGGLIVTALSYLPALKAALGAGPQVKKVMAAFQKKQSRWVYLSMVGLVLTGLAMGNRSPDFQGLFHFGNPYSAALSVKHLLVIVTIGISLYRILVLGGEKAGNTPPSPAKEKLSLRLLLVNAVMAVLVLLSSGVVAALAQPLVGG